MQKNPIHSGFCGIVLLNSRLYVSKVQAEVKKAWLRRSLTQDLKQKARMTSSGGGGSGGGGSCYYGGMMSHTTTHSVCVSAANPRSLSLTGGVVSSCGPAGGGGLTVRPARHGSLHTQTNLPRYMPGDTVTCGPQKEPTGGDESGVFARHIRAGKRNPDPRGQVTSPGQTSGADEASSSLSPKELETIL